MPLLFPEMSKCGKKVKMTLRPGGGAVRHNKNGAEIESVYRRRGFPITYEVLYPWPTWARAGDLASLRSGEGHLLGWVVDNYGVL